MPRLAVKLLLLDPEDRLLLIHSRDTVSRAECWYPVGGGVEPGESLQEAAQREAHEETGINSLPSGQHVWRRDHTYHYNGQTMAVREEWLLHRVARFQPAPTALTANESQTIIGFRWWNLSDLSATTATVFPPRLGDLTRELLAAGFSAVPTDITTVIRD